MLRYLAPEQAAGEPADARADLFALGSVLHEMLTGESPFDRPTSDEILLAVLQVVPPAASSRAPGVPAELDVIVTRALAKSLARRYPSAAALADDLRAVKSVLDAEAAERPTPEPPARAFPRSKAVAGALLLAAAALVAWWEWGALTALF